MVVTNNNEGVLIWAKNAYEVIMNLYIKMPRIEIILS